jgi:hypothetical protein
MIARKRLVAASRRASFLTCLRKYAYITPPLIGDVNHAPLDANGYANFLFTTSKTRRSLIIFGNGMESMIDRVSRMR